MAKKKLTEKQRSYIGKNGKKNTKAGREKLDDNLKI